MPIEFHCNHCGKMIRCGDEHAGKRGRCPSCHQSVYIPTPSDQIELLRLEPIDPNAEREKERLLRESRDLARRIMAERDSLPPEPKQKVEAAEPVEDARLSIDMDALIINYTLAMAQGNLAQAAELVRDIRRDPRKAEDVMQRLVVDELPPRQLAAVPRPVLIGFFKQLREQLKAR